METPSPQEGVTHYYQLFFSGSAGSDASLDRAPGPSSAPRELKLFRSCRWSRNLPPKVRSHKLLPLSPWKSSFPNLISTGCQHILQYSWGFRILYLHGLGEEPVNLFLDHFCTNCCIWELCFKASCYIGFCIAPAEKVLDLP